MSAAEGGVWRDATADDGEARREAEWQTRETRRRTRIARAHGHRYSHIPTPGCAKCAPRVVRRGAP